MRNITGYLLLAFSLVLLGTGCSEDKKKKLPPLPNEQKIAGDATKRNLQISEKEQELEGAMGSNVSPEDRQLSKELAFRNLKSLSRKGMNANVGMNIYTRFSTKGAMNAAPSPGKNMKGPMEAISFELLSSMEQQGLKAALKGCAKKRLKVTVTIDQKGKARLSEGQVFGTKLVECMAGKLGRLSFLEGKLRKGVVVLP